MLVYRDNGEQMWVEQLTIEEAQAVLERGRAEMRTASDPAQLASVRAMIADVEAHIDRLDDERRAAVIGELAVEQSGALWQESQWGSLGAPDSGRCGVQ